MFAGDLHRCCLLFQQWAGNHTGLLALVMLTLIYGCARLLAGRIGGMGALVMGFFL